MTDLRWGVFFAHFDQSNVTCLHWHVPHVGDSDRNQPGLRVTIISNTHFISLNHIYGFVECEALIIGDNQLTNMYSTQKHDEIRNLFL